MLQKTILVCVCVCIKSCPGLKCIDHKCVANSQIDDSDTKEENAKLASRASKISSGHLPISKPPVTCERQNVIKEGQKCDVGLMGIFCCTGKKLTHYNIFVTKTIRVCVCV